MIKIKTKNSLKFSRTKFLFQFLSVHILSLFSNCSTKKIKIPKSNKKKEKRGLTESQSEGGDWFARIHFALRYKNLLREKNGKI